MKHRNHTIFLTLSFWSIPLATDALASIGHESMIIPTCHVALQVSFQRAIRAARDSAELWEGLAAAYQALGRHSSALKSYNRALQLDPDRLYCLLQSGVLQHQLGEYNEALRLYDTALQVSPHNPVALLGAAESLLASAHVQSRLAAYGSAAERLQAAAQRANECIQHNSELQTAYRLLGDIELQHAAVIPLKAYENVKAASDASVSAADDAERCKDGDAFWRACGQCLEAQLAAMHRARWAYKRGLELQPKSSYLWSNVSSTYVQEMLLSRYFVQLGHPAANLAARKAAEEDKAALCGLYNSLLTSGGGSSDDSAAGALDKLQPVDAAATPVEMLVRCLRLQALQLRFLVVVILTACW